MLTKEQVQNIWDFRKKGYSRLRTAKEMGINPKTVARYWEGTLKSSRLEDYFHWARCPACGVESPLPKFLPSWLCPGCSVERSWKGCWYE